MINALVALPLAALIIGLLCVCVRLLSGEWPWELFR